MIAVFVRSLYILCICSLMLRTTIAMITVHNKCRGGIYPRSNVERFHVPDDKISWLKEFKEYNPPTYTSPSLHGKSYADPEIDDINFQPKWYTIDGNISRVSYMGEYQIADKYPLNPLGRTGIRGRGVLGRWGPNHAADPVVSRWKRLENDHIAINKKTDEPILQFVTIKRRDTGEWALPGGMVDPGEKVSMTAVREFQEEAMNSLVMTEDQKEECKLKLNQFFNSGEEVYRGYVDDPRNTDNAWMETVVYNFHDDTGDTVGSLNLHAGDDAVGVQWVDITPDLSLYASHKHIVLEVLKMRIRAHDKK